MLDESIRAYGDTDADEIFGDRRMRGRCFLRSWTLEVKPGILLRELCVLLPLENLLWTKLRDYTISRVNRRTFDQPRPECHNHLVFDVILHWCLGVLSFFFTTTILVSIFVMSVSHCQPFVSISLVVSVSTDPFPRLHRHEDSRLTYRSLYRERQTRVMYVTIFYQRTYAH